MQLAEEEAEGSEASPSPYTFMGYNMRSVSGLARGRGSRHFPAVLTHKAGLDMTVVDMLRPLLNGGLRPAAVSKLLLELHTKEHARAAVAHEEEIAHRREANAASEAAPLSPFADKKCWAGLVPGPDYLGSVYKAYSADIAPFLDAEVCRVALACTTCLPSLTSLARPGRSRSAAQVDCTGTSRTRWRSMSRSTTASHCTRACSRPPTRLARCASCPA